MASGEKDYYASRAAVGKLFVAVTMSTDPAHTLGFTSSLIATVRAALIQKLEESVKGYEDIPDILNTLLKFIVYQWKNNGLPEEYQKEINQRIDALFKTDSMAKFGLEVYRDTIFCDDLMLRWKQANGIYIKAPSAWAYSNEIVAEIIKQLLEIITRHHLMVFPQGEPFNVDVGGMDYGAIIRMAKEQALANGSKE
jgi:hypothetical protein